MRRVLRIPVLPQIPMSYPNSDSSQQSPSTVESIASNPLGNRLRNFSIVVVAIILSISLFLGLKAETASTSLSELAAEATPLDVALQNDKPTLMEFYANWCTTCQAMVQDMDALKQKYANQLNFVMLNVDNSKWLPEILQYRVDGIPHFVFLNAQSESIAQTIGEMPRSIMEQNIVALIDDQSLPYAQVTGQSSGFKAAVDLSETRSSDPKAHGSQLN
ncbi:MAG: thioredoxin family protein [Microcoleaceae cyanobacterium]